MQEAGGTCLEPSLKKCLKFGLNLETIRLLKSLLKAVRRACKKKLSLKIGSYDADELSLSTTEGGSSLEPDDPIPAPNTATTPLFISFREESESKKENHSKRIKTDWEVSKINQLSYDPSSVLFVLDSNYLANTGLDSEELVLYCRPTFHDQFKFLNDRVINEGVLGGIHGPPGTGKSATALSFAYTLDRKDWIVTWIHLSLSRFPVCVRLDGHLKKSTVISNVKYDELKDLLEEIDHSKKHIVFVDGYVSDGHKHIAIQICCNSWLIKDRVNRRLVTVSSEYLSYNEYLLTKQEKFYVCSWKKQEYLDAVRNPEFFSSVKNMLDSDLSRNSSSTCEDMVLSKLYFGGSSFSSMDV